MYVDEINILKQKLEDQIQKKDSYDRIYETSVMIDELLVEYYKEFEIIKKGSNCLKKY